MYQPYGTMEEVAGIATPGADPERERFTGKEFDREGEDAVNGVSGLNAYYFGARFLDPEIGMWMSADPADQFWNAYSYCGGNPINFVDPDGMKVGDNSIGTDTWLHKASEAAVGNLFLSLLIEALVNTDKFEVPDWAFGAMIGFGFNPNISGVASNSVIPPNISTTNPNREQAINWETFGYGVAGTLMGATSIVAEYYMMINTGTKPMSSGVALGHAMKSTGTKVGGATMLGVGVWDIYRSFQGKSSMMKQGLLEMPKTKIDALMKYYPYPGTL